MIIGPSPSLPALAADRVGRLLYSTLVAVAGPDRAHWVRPRGGGRVTVPAELMVELAGRDDLDVPAELEDDEALVLVSIDAEEERILAGSFAPEDPDPHVEVEEPTSGEATAPLAPPAVDPTDKAAFPTIDSLVAFAGEHSIDLAGARKRAEVEAAISAHLTTTTS